MKQDLESAHQSWSNSSAKSKTTDKVESYCSLLLTTLVLLQLDRSDHYDVIVDVLTEMSAHTCFSLNLFTSSSHPQADSEHRVVVADTAGVDGTP